jgi:hypothetical protein
MKEKRLRKKFEELSIRVNKAFKYGGVYGATTCDAYRRIIDELKEDAIPLILEELPKNYYWLGALERITQLKQDGHNNSEKINNWIEWGKKNFSKKIEQNIETV